MKNYDDLQRFKEKTQTQDINFRDMSGQSLENDQQRWAIIQQLSEEKNHDDVLETGQRIDRAQPQPVKSDAFTAPVVAQLLSARTVSTGSLLLDSVAASPKPVTPLPSLRAQAAVQTTPATGSLLQQISATAVPSRPVAPAPAQPAPAAALPPVGMPTPTPPPPSAPAAPGRFGGLFRTRPAEPVMLSKETLLKPLLEKIALCR